MASTRLRFRVVRLALLAGLGLGASSMGGAAQAAPSKSKSDQEQTRIVEQTKEEARARARKQSSTTRARTRRRSTSSAGLDASRVPRMSHPTVHRRSRGNQNALVGWAGALAEPPHSDRRRRMPPAALPPSYQIGIGERMAFDVLFAGNPVGMAEAEVTGYQSDPRGEAPHGAPHFIITGHAVTSGVLSMLSAMEDTMTTWVDAQTGAAVRNHNVVDYAGIGSKYKHRDTQIEFEGRGHVRIVDEKDSKVRKMTRRVPRDIFDPLSAMAWVRSLQLKDGERATAHVLDGPRLLRVEVAGRGPHKPEVIPPIATALRVNPEEIVLLEGTLTRVDKYDEPLPDKRAYTFRAYMTQDSHNLILSIETDMWSGVLRLILAEYQPARGTRTSPEDEKSPPPAEPHAP